MNARRRVHERLRAKVTRETRRRRRQEAFDRWYYSPKRLTREAFREPQRTACGDPFCPDPLCQLRSFP